MGRRVARGFRLSLFDCAVCLLAGCGLWASFPDLSIAIVMIPSAVLMISRVDRVGAWRAALYMFLVGLAFLASPYPMDCSGNRRERSAMDRLECR